MRNLNNFDIDSAMHGYYVHHGVVDGKSVAIRTRDPFTGFMLSHGSPETVKAIMDRAIPIARFAI